MKNRLGREKAKKKEKERGKKERRRRIPARARGRWINENFQGPPPSVTNARRDAKLKLIRAKRRLLDAAFSV